LASVSLGAATRSPGKPNHVRRAGKIPAIVYGKAVTAQAVAIDGRETAPAAATQDMYLRNGKAVPKLSQLGALAIAVPGALAAYDEALRQHGRLPLKRHLETAARKIGRAHV